VKREKGKVKSKAGAERKEYNGNLKKKKEGGHGLLQLANLKKT
jgi:hypothetical protein